MGAKPKNKKKITCFSLRYFNPINQEVHQSTNPFEKDGLETKTFLHSNFQKKKNNKRPTRELPNKINGNS